MGGACHGGAAGSKGGTGGGDVGGTCYDLTAPGAPASDEPTVGGDP